MRHDRLPLAEELGVGEGAQGQLLEGVGLCGRPDNVAALGELALDGGRGADLEEVVVVVGDAKDDLAAPEGLLEARLVVQVGGHHLDALLGKRPRGGRVGPPGDAADFPAGLLGEQPGDAAALAAGGTDDTDRLDHGCKLASGGAIEGGMYDMYDVQVWVVLANGLLLDISRWDAKLYL